MLQLSDRVTPSSSPTARSMGTAAPWRLRTVVRTIIAATARWSSSRRNVDAETDGTESRGKPEDVDLERQLGLIESDLNRGRARISFCGAIEARYVQEKMSGAIPHHVRSFTIALFMYNLFLVLDIWMIPDVIFQVIFVSLVILMPIAIMMIFLIQTRRLPAIPLLFIFLCMTLSVVFYAIISSDSPRAWLHIFIVPIVLLFSNIVIPFTLLYAGVLSVVATVAAAVVLSVEPQLDLLNRFFVTTVIASMTLFTLIATYRIETSDRRAYLLTLRERLRSETLAHRNARLRELSDLDGLTGLGNRRHFDETLAALWQAGCATGGTVTLLMIDIDHFKRLNDVYGHPGGDECLRVVARLLADETRRSNDTIFRYGGEEFAIMLENTADLAQATAVANRIRMRINGTPIQIDPHSPETIHVTVSIGHATVVPTPDSSSAHLIEIADQALYIAKRTGRNRVHPDHDADELSKSTVA